MIISDYQWLSVIHVSFKLIVRKELRAHFWTWGLRIDLEVTQVAQHLFQVIHVNIGASDALKPVEGLCDALAVFPWVDKSMIKVPQNTVNLAWHSPQWKILYTYIYLVSVEGFLCALYCRLDSIWMRKSSRKAQLRTSSAWGKDAISSTLKRVCILAASGGFKISFLRGARSKSKSDPQKSRALYILYYIHFMTSEWLETGEAMNAQD